MMDFILLGILFWFLYEASLEVKNNDNFNTFDFWFTVILAASASRVFDNIWNKF